MKDYKPINTNSPQFKKWFGNSKIVDENGYPLKVYKGLYPFDSAKEQVRGWKDPWEYPDQEPLDVINRNTPFPSFDSFDVKGVKIAGFFAVDKEVANRFAMLHTAATIYPCYLSIQHPYVIDGKGKLAGNIQFGLSGKPFRDAICSGEYDGVIIKNTKDEGTIIIALRPEQIKSAISNTGEFSSSNPKITESVDISSLSFRKWFGHSKVVDQSGKPLVVYHGTDQIFDEFHTNSIVSFGSHFGTAQQASWRTEEDENNTLLHGNIMPCYLSIQHPLSMRDLGSWYPDVVARELKKMGIHIELSDSFLQRRDILSRRKARNVIVNTLENLGYDGITYDNLHEGEEIEKSWIVFYPWQVKSAISNTGKFDPQKVKITENTIQMSLSFKNWFDGSKVVDKNGNPLVVYHGTDAKFDVFDRNFSKIGPSKFGFWFCLEKYFSEFFGGIQMPCYLRMRHPYKIKSSKWNDIRDEHAKDTFWFEQWRERIKSHGYDGLWVSGETFHTSQGLDLADPTVFAVFDSNQIKAVKNQGTFSQERNNIYEATKIPAFNKWFKQSKIIDKNGNPLVVYHGTSSDISQFKYEFTNKGFDSIGSGFYFTPNLDGASNYAEKHDEGQPNVLPCYLSIQKPIHIQNRQAIEHDLNENQIRRILLAAPNLDERLNDFGDVSYEGKENVLKSAIQTYARVDLLAQLFQLANDFYGDAIREFNTAVYKATGYDGIINKTDHVIVAWFPWQIKPAIGNRGAFNKKSENIAEKHMLHAQYASQFIENKGQLLDFLKESRLLRSQTSLQKYSIEKLCDIFFVALLTIQFLRDQNIDTKAYCGRTLLFPMFDKIYLSNSDLGNVISALKNTRKILNQSSVNLPVNEIKQFLRGRNTRGMNRYLFMKVQTRSKIHDGKLLALRREIIDSDGHYSTRKVADSLYQLLKSYGGCDIIILLQKFVDAS
ncbi:Uncharacterised protein [uncultured archaeon]|nr:Uncharacterised protein [uncultured archaeon]